MIDGYVEDWTGNSIRPLAIAKATLKYHKEIILQIQMARRTFSVFRTKSELLEYILAKTGVYRGTLRSAGWGWHQISVAHICAILKGKSKSRGLYEPTPRYVPMPWVRFIYTKKTPKRIRIHDLTKRSNPIVRIPTKSDRNLVESGKLTAGPDRAWISFL
jgi:hypothetical protein